MGAQQSNTEPKTGKSISKDEVVQILEKQSMHYENKQRELEKTVKLTESKILQMEQPKRQYEDALKILNDQKELYERKLKTLTSRVPVIANENNSTSCEGIQITPLSYSQNLVTQSTSTSLYPKLPLSANSGVKQGSSQIHMNATYNRCAAPAATAPSFNVNSAISTSHNVNATVDARHNVDLATGVNLNVNTSVDATHKTNRSTGSINRLTETMGTTNIPHAATGAIPKKSIRNSKQLKLNKANELKCRSCAQQFTSMIYECPNGHSSCSHCREQRVLCGVCNQAISDVRNRALEVFIGEVKVRCPNFLDGCSLHLKIAEIEVHSKECPYMELECPLALSKLCQWRGKLPQLSSHFHEMHQDSITFKPDAEQELIIRQEDSNILQLVQKGMYHFLVQIKMSAVTKMIYMTVQLVSTAHSAAKWSYEIHLYNKYEPRRKYQYTHVCQSNSTPLKDVFDEANCAAIPMSYAETFVNNGRVMYKLYIKKMSSARTHGSARQHC
ncbi:hypothetical protein ACJJTC_001508 [Scirpophaga incertulas]